MTLESLQPSPSNQPVQRRQDVHDSHNPVLSSDGKSKNSDKDQQQAKQHPVVNYLGQMTGQTVDVTA